MEMLVAATVAPGAWQSLALAGMSQQPAPAPAPEFDFAAGVAENIDALYRGALRMTGKAEEAQDLVQETFLRAYRFQHQFQPGTNFRAWTTPKSSTSTSTWAPTRRWVTTRLLTSSTS